MTSVEEEEQARAEAEARRQRILKQAEDRMDTVSGIPTADGAKSSSTSSKLAAMRRRRFKKKAAESNDVEPKEAKADEEKEKLKEPETKKEPEEEAVVEELNTPGVQADIDSGAGTAEKKYKGVARIRREKVLAQRKREEEESATATTSTAATKQTAAATVSAVPAKQKVDKVPIYMHMLVVVLLFLAGLDVGLQQGMDYGADVITVVQEDLAPREAKFVRLIPKVIRDKAGVTLEEEAAEKVETSKALTDSSEYEVQGEDEFGEPVGSDKEEPENIDPLFGVDLDKITAGPGIFMALGRFAVMVHRLLLKIFFYLPKSIFVGILNTIFQFTKLPPLLCLIALSMRQVVGKVMLGAKLPDKVVDEKEHKDIMCMVKNFVSGFLLKSFPNAASLYDAWVHLRADMYVVVCGLLVGFAWSHTQLITQLEDASEAIAEPVMETVADTVQETMAQVGVSDEL